MELRGHGQSQNANHWLDPQQMVADCAGLLDHLALPSAHVAGYAEGGYLGLMLASAQPDRVSTLLMLATTFWWRGAALQQRQAQMHGVRHPFAAVSPLLLPAMTRFHRAQTRGDR